MREYLRPVVGSLGLATMLLVGPEPAMAATAEQIRTVQQHLADDGYGPGPVNGEMREDTAEAIRLYEADWGLPKTGQVTDQLIQHLTAGVEPYWLSLDNQADCQVWVSDPRPEQRAEWSGACHDGKTAGQGVLTWRHRLMGDRVTATYEGAHRVGLAHGRGVQVLSNGDRYEGEFVDGARTGHGVFVWNDSSDWAGDRYDGDFLNGARTGRGIYEWASGWRYEGDFVDAAMHGKGRLVGPSGDVYEGDFQSNARHGYGSQSYESSRYVGNFANDRRNGQGTLKWNEGGSYVGGWLDDQQHGNGVEQWPDGANYKGGYANHRPHGFGAYRTAEGEEYSGVWNNGCFDHGGRRFRISATAQECGF